MDKLRQSGSIIKQLKRMSVVNSLARPANRVAVSSREFSQTPFRPGKVAFSQLIVVALGKEEGWEGGGLRE